MASDGCAAVGVVVATGGAVRPAEGCPRDIYVDTLVSMAEDARVTPADLKRELGVDPKLIRKYLRERYGVLPPDEPRWLLTRAQADDVRRRFRR